MTIKNWWILNEFKSWTDLISGTFEIWSYPIGWLKVAFKLAYISKIEFKSLQFFMTYYLFIFMLCNILYVLISFTSRKYSKLIQLEYHFQKYSHHHKRYGNNPKYVRNIKDEIYFKTCLSEQEIVYYKLLDYNSRIHIDSL